MEKMTTMTINVREDSYRWLKSLPAEEQRALVKAFSDSLDECRIIREYPREEVEKIVRDAWAEVQINELRREIEKQKNKMSELEMFYNRYPLEEVEKIVRDARTEAQINELRREIEKQNKTAELDKYCNTYPTKCEGHYLIGAMKVILGRP